MKVLEQELKEHDDRRVRLAIEVFCYRARKYIGAYLASMGGADAIVFTGGIGEHSPEIRGRICAGLEWAGLTVDATQNQQIVGVRAESARRIETTRLGYSYERGTADCARYGTLRSGRAAPVVKRLSWHCAQLRQKT
jgi:acetate kinase